MFDRGSVGGTLQGVFFVNNAVTRQAVEGAITVSPIPYYNHIYIIIPYIIAIYIPNMGRDSGRKEVGALGS